MVVLDMTIVNIALPTAQETLGFSDNDRQWVVTAYALAFGGLLLLGGRLSDLLGRKRTFLIGIIGFAGASAFGGASTSFTHLITARALQGLFAAVLAPAALSVLTTTFTVPKERARAFGVFGAIAGAGGAIGLLLGGFLTDAISWRWTLNINVIIAVFALVGTLIFLSGARGEKQQLDFLGALLGGGGLFALVFGFSRAAPEGWSSPMTWAPLVASAALLVGFVLWQQRSQHPLLPLWIVTDRNRGAALLAILITGAAVFAAFLFGTYYLQNNLGYSAMRTGVAFLPQVLALVLAAQLCTNIFLPRFGPKVMVPIGMTLGAIGMIILASITPTSTYASHVLPGLIVMGLGMGTTMPASIQTATLGIGNEYAGVGSAMVSTAQQIGGAVGTAVLNTIATSVITTWVANNGQAVGTAWGQGPDGLAVAGEYLAGVGATAATATPEQLAGAQAAVEEAAKGEVALQAAIHGDTRAFWIAAIMFLGGAVIAGLLFRRRVAVQDDAVPDATPQESGVDE
jgi:EmrB/QacA subfamily drug resistance transporter